MTKEQYEVKRASILGKKVGGGAIAEEAAGDAAGKAAGGPSGYVPPHMRNREAPAAGGQGGCVLRRSFGSLVWLGCIAPRSV